MDGVHIGDFGSANDAIDAQITLVCGSFTDTDRFIGELNVHGIGIDLRVNGNRADIEFFTGSDYADGDFAAISYQKFFEHVVSALKG